MTSKNRLSTAILLMVEVILLISSALFCTVSVYRARVGIRRAIQQRMLDIANCASGSVSGDVLRDLTEEDVGSADYREVYHTLSVFRDNAELSYVYALREQDSGHFIFLVDTDPSSPAAFGDTVKYTDALARAGGGTAAVDEVPYSDAWGQFYSAYSPVFDSSGAVAGIIAVDFSAEWFDAQLSGQTRSTVTGYVVILCLSLFVAAVLSLLTVRPFVRQHEKTLEEKLRAESASRAKSDFLANMSHEIRTPINAVLGMNEMVLREERRARALTDAPSLREALRSIGRCAGAVDSAGHNLLALVNDILDFSKIEAGRLDLTPAPYQLSSLLNDLSNLILFKAREKGLTFEIDADSALPDRLCGDEVRVRQVLTNLLTNAVKYTAQGSVTLVLRGEKQADGSLLMTASVHDTGIGIRQADLEKLFTKFQRLEMERNSTIEGTGLGLAITQRLLDMMGGTIRVESEYGKGSTFTVTIPQGIVSDEPLGDFRERFEASAAETGPCRECFRAPGAHILIVDDTRINLTVAVNLLKCTQLQIDTASGGAEAVALAEKNAYDVILMDQRMPGMDGTEALRRIRALETGLSKDAPVICLTADAVIGARERYLAEGFSDYLTKPIDSAALEKLLLRHLPKEKVELVRAEQSTSAAEEPPEEGAFAPLRGAGIDPGTGLRYCQNDAALYRSLLSEYARGASEKAEKLRRSLAEEDWKAYCIEVHALKSSSKMLGAEELSSQAAALEAAAGEGDGETVRRGHAALLERFEATTGAILAFLPEEQAEESGSGPIEFFPEVGGEEILEFLPDSD